MRKYTFIYVADSSLKRDRSVCKNTAMYVQIVSAKNSVSAKNVSMFVFPNFQLNYFLRTTGRKSDTSLSHGVIRVAGRRVNHFHYSANLHPTSMALNVPIYHKMWVACTFEPKMLSPVQKSCGPIYDHLHRQFTSSAPVEELLKTKT